MFTDGQVVFEVLLMHAPKRAQEVAHRSPQAFDRVDMHLPDAIAIIIPGPFLLRVTDCGVATADALIAEPLICMTTGCRPGEGVHMATQGPPIGVLTDSQSAAARPSPHRPYHRGPIIGIGAVSLALVRTPPRWISGVSVALAFFPRHSETSHRFPFRHRATVPRATAYSRWLGVCGESCAPSYGSGPNHPPAPGHFRPYRRQGRVRTPGVLTTHCPQILSPCRGYRRERNVYSDNPVVLAWSDETRGRRARPCGNVDSESPAGENNVQSR